MIYRPAAEDASHYFEARLADQFDAVVHLSHTRALEPLERTSLWDTGGPLGDLPERVLIWRGLRRRVAWSAEAHRRL